ncbi:MAG: YeeE/YedE family protein, partial [Eubacteriaceae bacterium]|nr:YeeE/YedE family protein [Eubacteriaceae bacterium]
SRSRFGFAGGIKRVYVTGEGTLTTALTVMFAIATTATAAIHYSGIIKYTPYVNAVNIALIFGAFLFGIGMILAGGCASGTLTDAGEGEGRAWIAALFFVMGSLPGAVIRDWLVNQPIGKVGGPVYLPDLFGLPGAIMISLAGLLAIYILAKKYENLRKNEGTFAATEYEDFEESLKKDEELFDLFSFKTYHKLFVERWSFMTGGILLAILFVAIIATAGMSWGVTGVFVSWGVGILQMFGVEFTSPALVAAVQEANKGILTNAVSLRNIGIMMGALLYFLTAGRFEFNRGFNLKDAGFYAVGGTLMGIGARLANGCNVGAMFSGIANLSLSGWIFTLMMCLGAMVVLKGLAGKVNTVPASRQRR